MLLGIGSMPAWDQGQVCQSVQDGGQSMKWPGIPVQYPRDIVKPAGLKHDVNSLMRSVECNFIDLWTKKSQTTFDLWNNVIRFRPTQMGVFPLQKVSFHEGIVTKRVDRITLSHVQSFMRHRGSLPHDIVDCLRNTRMSCFKFLIHAVYLFQVTRTW